MATETRNPTSDIVESGTFSGASAGTRYTRVDDHPDSAGADSLGCDSNTGGHIVFGAPVFTIPAGSTAISLALKYYDDKVSSGVANLGGRIRVGGVDYNAATHNPTELVWVLRTDTWATNPATTAAWTVDDINGTGANPLQGFGFVGTDWSPDVRVASVQAEVTYTAGAGPTTHTPDNLAQGHVLAVTTAVQDHVLAPASSAQAHALETVVLTQDHVHTPADLAQAHTLGTTTATQNHILDPANLAQSNALGAATVIQNYDLSPGDAAHGHTLGTTTATQNHDFTSAATTHTHSLGTTTVIVGSLFAPDDTTQTHTLGTTSIEQVHLTSPHDISQTQGTSISGLSVNHILAPADLAHTHSLGLTFLSDIDEHYLIPAALLHAHVLRTVLPGARASGRIVADIRKEVLAANITRETVTSDIGE